MKPTCSALPADLESPALTALSSIRRWLSSVPRPILRLFLYVAVSVVTRAVVLGADIINGDEASYVVGARTILSGGLPYTSFADNKPPLIYLYFALAQFFGDGIFPVRLLTAVVTVPLTAFAVSAFYRHDRRGLLGGLAFLIASASYDAGNMLAVNCEIVMSLPIAWALVLCRDDETPSFARSLSAGILIGLAVLVKYQAVLALVAMAGTFALAAPRPRWKHAGRAVAGIVAGCALPVALTALIFAALGGFEGFFYWNVTHNVGYVMNPTTVSDTLMRSVVRVGPFTVATIVLWHGAWRTIAGHASPRRRLLWTTMLVASGLAGVLGLRFFAHYFVQLYVPLALAAAPWLDDLTVAPLSRPAKSVLAYSALVLVSCTVFNAVRYVANDLPNDVISRRVAARLEQDACYPNASMFVWGSLPMLYYHADLPPAARFFFPEFPLVRYYSGNRTATSKHRPALVRDHRSRHWHWLMADLDANQPTYVLDTAPAKLSMWEYFPLTDYPMLDRYVHQSYEPIDTIDAITIYRRRGCDGTLMARARTRHRRHRPAPNP
jgi:hypothetical protein